MPVIAVVNQKGGTGKTTISTNLACAFADRFQVLLLDADGQSSALDWADSRAQPLLGLEVRGVEPGRLLQDVRLSAPDYHGREFQPLRKLGQGPTVRPKEQSVYRQELRGQPGLDLLAQSYTQNITFHVPTSPARSSRTTSMNSSTPYGVPTPETRTCPQQDRRQKPEPVHNRTS